jgi:thiol-disulfide isomerase/thioredoxin
MIYHHTFDKPTDVKSLVSNTYDKKPVIIMVYMNGCPYCDLMKPTWDKFKRSNVVDTIDLNYKALPMFNSMNAHLTTQANAFPFIKSNVMKKEHQGMITIDELNTLAMKSRAMIDKRKDEKKGKKEGKKDGEKKGKKDGEKKGKKDGEKKGKKDGEKKGKKKG